MESNDSKPVDGDKLPDSMALGLAMAGFDFAALDIAAASDTPIEIELVHPDSGDGLGVFVSVIGAESETFQAYVRQEANRARRKAFEAQRKNKQPEPSTVEEDEESLTRALAVCVKAWRTVIAGVSKPYVIWGGEELACTTDNVVRWLTRFQWARNQVNKATGDLGNFIRS